MELKDLARILKQRRMIVILVTLVVAALAAASGIAPDSSYSASAQVLAPQTTVSSFLSEDRPLGGIEWQASIARSAEVLERAASAPGNTSAADLSSAVSVAAATADSEYLLTITASAATPEEAAARANAVADAYVAVTAEELQSDVDALVSDIAAGDTGSGPDSGAQASAIGDASAETLMATLKGLPSLDSARARVLKAATAPAVESAASRIIRLGLLGLTLGLALGVAAAFVIDQLDDRLMSMSGLRRRSTAPVVAGIAGIAGISGGAGNAAGLSAADADTLLILASRLLASGERTVLAVSPDAPALASTAGISLAGAFARSGAKTVVIDCDLRHPGGSLGGGLAGALGTPARAAEFLEPLESGALGLGSRTPAEDPLRLLTSTGMRDLIARLLEAHDAIVMLCPDWALPADTLALAPLASTAVVPVVLGRSRSQALEGLTQALAANDVDLAAVLAQGGAGWDERPLMAIGATGR